MNRLSFVLLLLLVRVLHDIIYIYAISPIYEYAGFYLQIDEAKLFWSYVILLCVGSLNPQSHKPSNFLLAMLQLFVLMPVISLWALKDESSVFAAYVTCAFLVISALLRTPRLRIPTVREGQSVGTALSVLVLSVAGYYLVSRGATGQFNWNPLAVYELRETVHETVFQGLAGYFIAWVAKVIAPVILAVALYRRWWIVAAAAVGVQILLFGMTGHKEYALYPVLVVFVFLAARSRVPIQHSFLVAVTSVLVAALLVCLSDAPALARTGSAAFVHRTFTVIGENHFAYFHFFQTSPFVFLSNSVLAFASQYPFSAPVAELIGYGRYSAGSEAFANAGYIASAYMHFGAAGIFGYSVLVGLILRVYDSLIVNRIAMSVGVPIAAAAVFQLVNADLTTALLTHGIGLSLLMLWLLGNSGEAVERRTALP